MIVYVVGVPGAGKTYYAVDKIFNYIKDDKYETIYTNIDKFDMNFSSKLHKFDYEEFYENIKDLYYIYKDKNTTDDDLIQRVKDFGYYKALFVIDEAHNFFDTPDTIINWLFSYHRHLFFDFLLITQNLALIDTKYKKFAEYFVRAVPTSLQLFSNTFKYKKFIDSRMSQKSMAGVENIKKSPEIFDLYHSGDSVKAPNIIKKYLIYFVVGMIFTVFLFNLVVNFMRGGNDIKKSDVNASKISDKKTSVSLGVRGSFDRKSKFVPVRDTLKDDEDEFQKGSFYYFVTCYSNSCKFKSVDYSFSINSIVALIKEFNCTKLFINKDNGITDYSLKCKDMSKYLSIFKEKNQKLGGYYEDKKVVSNPIVSSFSDTE